MGDANCEPTIEPWGDGSAFLVKAHVGARRDRIAGVHDGMVKVEVTTAPEKGKANKAIAKFLAKQLGVAAGDIELLSGETNPRKRFGVRGIEAGELRSRLLSVL